MNALAVIAVLFTLGSGLLFVVLLRRLGHLKPNIVRLQLTFRPKSFRKILGLWEEAGVHRYRSTFALDHAFLICYAIAGAAGGAWLASRVENPSFSRDCLPWLLPAAAAFDAVENKLHQVLVARPPGGQPGSMFLAAGVSASAKWALLLVAVPVALHAWLGSAA